MGNFHSSILPCSSSQKYAFIKYKSYDRSKSIINRSSQIWMNTNSQIWWTLFEALTLCFVKHKLKIYLHFYKHSLASICQFKAAESQSWRSVFFASVKMCSLNILRHHLQPSEPQRSGSPVSPVAFLCAVSRSVWNMWKTWKSLYRRHDRTVLLHCCAPVELSMWLCEDEFSMIYYFC